MSMNEWKKGWLRNTNLVVAESVEWARLVYQKGEAPLWMLEELAKAQRDFFALVGGKRPLVETGPLTEDEGNIHLRGLEGAQTDYIVMHDLDVDFDVNDPEWNIPNSLAALAGCLERAINHGYYTGVYTVLAD